MECLHALYNWNDTVFAKKSCIIQYKIRYISKVIYYINRFDKIFINISPFITKPSLKLVYV